MFWVVPAGAQTDLAKNEPSPAWADAGPAAVPTVNLSLLSEVQIRQLQPAVESLTRGDVMAFRAAHQTAKAGDDTLPDEAIVLAHWLTDNAQTGEALSTLEAYALRSPDDPHLYLSLGKISLASGRWTDAKLAADKAVVLIQQNQARYDRSDAVLAAMVGLRGEIAQRRRQWDEAIGHFQRLTELRPTDAVPAWRIGQLQLQQGNVNQGIDQMRQARGRDSRLPAAELTAAEHFMSLGETGDAEKWFRAAIVADKDDPVRWARYLKWLLLSDRVDDARSLLAKVPSAVTEDRRVRLLAGVLARYEDDLVRAEQIFSKLQKMNPHDVEATDQLALVLIRSDDDGKRDRAVQLSQANLRRAPQLETTIATAAWVQWNMGSTDVADRMLGQLAGQIALSPQTVYYVSRSLESKGKHDDAIRLRRLAADSPGLFPDRARVLAELKGNQAD